MKKFCMILGIKSSRLLNNILFAELLGKCIKSLWVCEENLYDSKYKKWELLKQRIIE